MSGRKPSQSMQSMYPARIMDISALQMPVPELFQFLDAQLRLMKMKPLPIPDKYHDVAVYEQGTKAVKVVSDLFDVLSTAGGRGFSWNLHFYLVVELLSPTELVFSVAGHEEMMLKGLHEKLEPVFVSLYSQFPEVNIQPWSSALELPKDKVSSPAGFRKFLGIGSWFLWT